MSNVIDFLQNWGGICLLLILAIIGIVFALKGSTTPEERALPKDDPDHYVLRLPLSRIGSALVFLAAGVVVDLLLTLLRGVFPDGKLWLLVLIEVAVAVVAALLFWFQLARVVRRRVFVNGEKIVVTPAVGAPIETMFSQIRTVADKKSGRDGGVIGKRIRTKEGKRFEVINTMSGFERFCAQLDAKVELPDLTKKFGRKTEAAAEEETEEL